MTYRVKVSEQADADLRGIYEYIAFRLRSARNAARQLERLEKAIYGLDTMPNKYGVYAKGKWKERGLRRMPVDNYQVFYIPDAERRTVEVLRVLYGRMDADRALDVGESKQE